MNEPAIICPVCACPCKREVDIMLLQGWSADDICEMLPESPRRPHDIKAHQYAGHVDIDAQALIAVTIQLAQDIRAKDKEVSDYLAEQALRSGDMSSMPSGGRRGQGNPMSTLMFRDVVNFRFRYVELIAKIAGVIGQKKGDKEGDTFYITENHLNVAAAQDPDLPFRVAKAQMDKAGFEIRKKSPAKLPKPDAA